MRHAGRTAAFAAVAQRVLPAVDGLFAGRRKTPSGLGTGLPVCFLTTVGRRTGKRGAVPLLFVRDGAALVVAESNWGSHRRPAWALNLDAGGPVTVAIAGRVHAVTARRATPDEAALWWPRLIEVWPGWKGYRRRAGREIALYALEPVPVD